VRGGGPVAFGRRRADCHPTGDLDRRPGNADPGRRIEPDPAAHHHLRPGRGRAIVGEASVTLRFRHLVLAAAVAVAVQLPITAVAWSAPAGTCLAADGAHHVAVVVQHGSGATVVRCVAFAGASLSGEQVLKGSGIPYQTVSFGGIGLAVCQVDGEPAEFPPSCWTTTSPFWTLFVARKGGSWTPSSLGISAQVFRDGDSEGLRFEAQTAPVAPTIYGNCPTATPPPVTPRPTRSPAPTAVPTPARTGTAPTPEATSSPSQTPSPSPSPMTSSGAIAQASPADSAGAIAAIDSSPSPISAGLTSAPTAGTGDGSPSVDPLALLIGVIVIGGLGGLAVVRVRSSRPGRTP
jgi:hypothetical protein